MTPILCDFPVEDSKCCRDMVMWTVDRPQKPRCEIHRPDKHAWDKKICSGCFQPRPLVLAIDSKGEKMFCDDCLIPSGSVYSMLVVFFTYLISLVRR